MPSRLATPDADPEGGEDQRLVDLKIRTEKLEHWSRRIGLLIKVPAGLLALALLIFLVVTALNASQSRGIMIDSFDVPTSLAASESDGSAIADMVRARFAAMRANTFDQMPERALLADWSSEYRIPLPQTGTTVGEFANALRRLLGHDVHVSGAVTRDGGRFSLILRIGTETLTLEAQSLSRLVELAAEAIFRKTDPYLFAVHLAKQRSRYQESTQLFIDLATRSLGDRQRARALNGLAVNVLELYGECREAIPILIEARRLDPDLGDIYRNLANAHHCLGHNQAAADATVESLRRTSPEAGQMLFPWLRSLYWDEDNRASYVGDVRRRLALSDMVASWQVTNWALDRAETLALLGRVSESRAVFDRYCAVMRRSTSPCESRGRAWYVRYAQASALEDWAGAARFLRESNARYEAGHYTRMQITTQAKPLEAMALAWSGNPIAAQAALRGLPGECYLCARARAIVAEARGEPSRADLLFGQAISLAPRLPFAYAEWGRALLARGDAHGALRLFERALAHGPELPDARKGQADALTGLGRYGEAELAYRRAAERAPRWGALYVAWAQALWRLRHYGEARARLRAAATMDLSPANLEMLDRLMRAAGIRPA